MYTEFYKNIYFLGIKYMSRIWITGPILVYIYSYIYISGIGQTLLSRAMYKCSLKSLSMDILRMVQYVTDLGYHVLWVIDYNGGPSNDSGVCLICNHGLGWFHPLTFVLNLAWNLVFRISDLLPHQLKQGPAKILGCHVCQESPCAWRRDVVEWVGSGFGGDCLRVVLGL